MPSSHQISNLFILTLLISAFGGFSALAQNNNIAPDSSKIKNDTIIPVKASESKFALSSKVDYTASDSIRFNIKEQKVYLYGNAVINYEDLELKADYIEIAFGKNELFAKGIADSLNKIAGEPIFTQGTQSFTSSTLSYNFKTKKGIISAIITKEGDSYLHGKTVKKFADNSINMKNGLYTTCDSKHPHYEIKFSKARIIPDDKIVTGPAYLCIEDVPTPIALPFGFFPNKKGQLSGILIPSYGESATRGFFLENGGYYMGLGQHFDLALRGDIYSKGSWAFRTISNYSKKYKFTGNIYLGYGSNIEGEKGTPSFSKRKDFNIRWTHSQDAKARPNSRFTANVNAGSSKYNKYNPSSSQDYLSNTMQSNISYSTMIAGIFNFQASMSHSQNTLTKSVALSLPEMSLSVNRFYPLRNPNKAGKLRWYENISVGYSMNAKNYVNTYDSLFWRKETLEQMQNGMKHAIPVSSTVKVLKVFNFTNTINYFERWYLQSVEKHWAYLNDTGAAYLRTDTLQGFKAARDFNYSSALSTRLYGMYQFKNCKVIALRHVLTPTLSFGYTPDFGSKWWGYYRYYTDQTTGEEKKYYSIFEQGIYGSPPRDRSGALIFALANNLEMKVRSKKDTLTGTKKISLIDNFTISGGYDVAKDSLNFSRVTMSGRTRLFKNLDISYASSWDPYIINDSTGININKSEWKVNHRLFRPAGTNWAFNLNWSLRSKQKTKPIVSENASEEEIQMIQNNPDNYVDFDQPWSLNIQYQVQYIKSWDATKHMLDGKVIQTLGFNGDINITPKWKIGFRSGYDFEQKDLSYTSIDIYRDLHCWELVFNWIPMGFRKSYNMTIRVKSSVLQDLKLTKKKDFRDNW